jgi:uncharacterized membrane protein
MFLTLKAKLDKFVDKINSTKDYYFIIGFVIFNLILKFSFISSKDISHDEPFTIFHAQASWDELWVMLNSEPNPPLFFLLLHFWVKLFGISPLSVRFLPVIFSALTVIPLYKLSRLFGRNTLAVVVICLFSFSNAHLASAHDARSYSLFAFFAVLSSFELFRILYSVKSSKGQFALLPLYYFLMIYSHHIGFIVGMIHVGIILFNYKRINREMIVGLIITGVGTLALYAHYIPVFYNSFTQTTSSGTVNVYPSPEALYGMIRYYMNAPVIAVFSLVSVVFFVVNIFRGRYKELNISLFILFIGLYLAMYFLSDLVVLFIDRYVLFVSLFFYVIVGLGIKYATKNNLIRSVAFLTILIAMIVSVDLKSDNNRHIKQISSLIKSKETQNRAVVMCPVWTNHRFSYYYDQNVFKSYSNFDEQLIANNIYSINSKEELDNISLEKFDQIIYLDGWAEVVDPQLSVLHSLDSSYKKTYENYSFKGYRILIFDK